MSDPFSEWCWDGASIESIKALAPQYRLSLSDLVDDHFVGGWPSSVPEPYRGDRTEADRTENGMAGRSYYMQILVQAAANA
ncbi:hypothetical protein [Pseudomonas alabamensis]|uniref:hypothetical protein n=1 Tax=Pseudomonas alabamensis TaxID=3064349 RepID=UPI0011AB1668